MAKRRRATKGDVAWSVPGRKTPIAYSTKAASDLIVVLGEDGATIQEAHDRINYDPEARAVLEKYIARGFGAVPARQFFR